MGHDGLRAGHLDLLLLGALARGPAHGYGVIVSLREHSGGAFDLPEGTVYPALHKLERQGLLVSRWDEDSARRRRLYQLTPDGHRSLATRREEFGAYTRGVQGVLQWAIR